MAAEPATSTHLPYFTKGPTSWARAGLLTNMPPNSRNQGRLIAETDASRHYRLRQLARPSAERDPAQLDATPAPATPRSRRPGGHGSRHPLRPAESVAP